MDKRLKLEKQKRVDMIKSIQAYFLKERDEDLGELAAGLILDFFMEELVHEFYNQGVYDAQRYMATRVEDMLEIQIYKR